MWFDGQRQPDTLYVANISRGKDSTAMLRAIQLLNFPLDAIVSVDVWATQDIPAELPPMVAFKDEYDRKVLERFGVPVTRVCAQKPKTWCSQIVNVERERERESQRLSYEDIFYRTITPRHKKKRDELMSATPPVRIYGFPQVKGVWCNSFLKRSALKASQVRSAVGVQENSNEQRCEISQDDVWVPEQMGQVVQRIPQSEGSRQCFRASPVATRGRK